MTGWGAAMTYDLGIDLGTTSTAAAVLRDGGTHPEAVALGGRLAVVPSVVYRGADGTVLVGESAERRAGDEPDRVVREVKRRLGDDVPPVVGGEPWPAEEIAAVIVAWVLARVAEREGGPARRVVVTRPATWGDFRCDRLRAALAAAGLAEVELLAEPHAAVLGHAALRKPVTVGAGGPDAGVTTAVYDLGGGTFDAAVARRAPDGTVTLLGPARGLDRVGGIDFDEAVLAHVRAEVADQLAALDPHDPETWQALHRLRRECVEAKEALSADTEVTVPVVLPTGRRSVRLGRADFEAHIRDAVAATVEEFLVTLADADVAPHELDHVLLAGGSSTIPLVGRMLTEALGRPVSADADPLTVVALGAAVAARASAGGADDPEPAPVRGPQRPPATVTGLFEDLPESEDVDPPRGRGLRRALVASVVMAAVVAVAVTVPLPLDDAVGDSVRGAVRDAFGAPEAALTVPPTAPVPAFAPSPAVAPPTVVARPLSAATPLAPAGGPVPAAAVPAIGAPAGTPAGAPASAPASATGTAPSGAPSAAAARPASASPTAVAATPAASETASDSPADPPVEPTSEPTSASTEPEPTGSTAPPVEQSAEETPEPADPPAEAQTEDGSGGDTAPAEEPAGEPA
ncbi:Hsp70 family protein [Actinomycetospora sp. CA-053990]|uniref:Hsp70 family protein n=1 Tax=Actinomycetospora sp. CA-053990 TaxID=3239891 RepID=UPI003D8D3E97